MDDKKIKVINFFDGLSYDNMSLVEEFYSNDVHFIDPLTNLRGVGKIKNYYANLYKAVIDISFEYSSVIVEDENVTLEWVMKLKATGIKSGKEIRVPGISIMKFNNDDKVEYHRDYYDMGEFVYEHIPILNKIIFYIKKKLAH